MADRMNLGRRGGMRPEPGHPGRHARRPPRPGHRSLEYPLRPVEGTWLELLPDDADDDARTFFALLDEGLLELWQRDDGAVHVYDGGGHSELLFTAAP